jgi:imidazolonepropionase-like amidohydrolase
MGRMIKQATRRSMWMLSLLCLAGNVTATEFLELRDFQLIDGTGAPARTVQRLVAVDGSIVQIDDEGSTPEPQPQSRWTRIDLAGAWVIPGLIDTHVHIGRFPDTHAKAREILDQAVRGGITAIRDLGGDARTLAELERAIGAGELIGPDIVSSAMFGGADIFVAGPIVQFATGRAPGDAAWARRIDANSDLRLLVAEAKGTGARNLKLYGDMSPALVARLISEARAQGLLTTAHATVFPAGPKALVDAGVGSLAHAAYLVWAAVDQIPDDYQRRTAGPWEQTPADHPRLQALYRDMAEAGVTLDATLYVYEQMQSYPGVPHMPWTVQAAAWGAEATRHAHAAGVRVTTGTDWFEPRNDRELPHTHEELVLLVDKAGFSPLQAIEAGTRNGAIALGLERTQGTIAPGKLADLIVLEADPLADIRNTQKIRFTLRKGRVVER